MAAIWTRAFADGAPRTLTAQIRYELVDPDAGSVSEVTDAQWVFIIEGPGKPFVREYADDCIAP